MPIKTEHAGSPDPVEVDLSDYRWENRILLIFSDSESNESYQEQLKAVEEHQEGIKDRDLIVISVFSKAGSNIEGTEITQESAEELRNDYRDEDEPYTFILIGKDGTVKMRSNEVVPVEELFRRIDSMPMRQREMQNDGA